jgi:hypothetical protein
MGKGLGSYHGPSGEHVRGERGRVAPHELWSQHLIEHAAAVPLPVLSAGRPAHTHSASSGGEWWRVKGGWW